MAEIKKGPPEGNFEIIQPTRGLMRSVKPDVKNPRISKWASNLQKCYSYGYSVIRRHAGKQSWIKVFNNPEI